MKKIILYSTYNTTYGFEINHVPLLKVAAGHTFWPKVHHAFVIIGGIIFLVD